MTSTDSRPTPDSITSTLTERQQDAVEYTDGPLLIVAGPGSGKTRVMSHRVAYLIGELGVPPWQVLAVTFTNKAARELRERCERLLGGDVPDLQVRTFHSWASQLLRREGGRAGLDPGFSIYDGDDQIRLMRQILDQLEVDTKRYAPRAILAIISNAKNLLLDAQHFEPSVGSYFEEIASRAYEQYEKRLREANAVDFDDLLLVAHRLLDSNIDLLETYQRRYKHLLIDEFQDTNPIQLGLARLLAGGHENICVVGDPNQSIYSWRHADPRNMLDFKKFYPNAKIVALDQNYRSTQTIIEAAAAVIGHNQGRIPNDLWTDNPVGGPIVIAEAYTEEEEADLVLQEVMRLRDEESVDLNEIAVMYRINAQSRALEVACNRHGLPYQLVGGLKFYERREIRDLIAYLRVIANPPDDIALERIINQPARGISQKSIDEIRASARGRGTSEWEAIANIEEPGHELRSALNKRAVNSVSAFVDMIKFLADRSHQVSVVELMDVTLERSGYKRLIQEDLDRGDERWDNILELRGTAKQFDGTEPREELLEFLEDAALVSAVDTIADDEEGLLTLITLHQAKGLEYDAVFMVGMEEGMLPHIRSMESAEDLEEERRLCYVGMTRAKRRLYMLRAFRRSFRGMTGASLPSRFLDELPEKFTARESSSRSSSIKPRARRTEPTVPTPMQIRAKLSAPSPAPAARQTSYSPGEQVGHEVFGEGIVISVDEGRGDQMITVIFKTAGQKMLSAEYAHLKKIEKVVSPSKMRPQADEFIDT
ncbi:MAG: UvrD-helicase domain-containing protein [Chloroflexi bacterium]|nr:UvrD-helicase domain-containing protein [Chloroflexota bacterium]